MRATEWMVVAVLGTVVMGSAGCSQGQVGCTEDGDCRDERVCSPEGRCEPEGLAGSDGGGRPH